MTNEEYDEIAHTPDGWVAALQILSKHMRKGMREKFFLEAEHDIIYSGVAGYEVSETSEDGKILYMLGWHIDCEIDLWVYYT